MKIGDRVKLRTFNGHLISDKQIHKSEDYWRIIGETGTVQKDPKENEIYASFSEKPRVLVKFDKELSSFGLIAHNNVENSLWIMESDLQPEL